MHRLCMLLAFLQPDAAHIATLKLASIPGTAITKTISGTSCVGTTKASWVPASLDQRGHLSAEVLVGRPFKPSAHMSRKRKSGLGSMTRLLVGLGMGS